MRTYFIFAFHILMAFGASANAAITPYNCPPSFAGCIDVKGEITRSDANTVKQIADQISGNSKRTFFVRLDSDGGNIESAISIGTQLRKLSAFVVITEGARCLSACVFILAGATNRNVFGSVGVHRPYSTRTDARDFATVQQEFRRISSLAKAFLEDMNIPSQLYDAMVRVPPEKIKILSDKELREFGLSEIDPVEQELMDAAEARRFGLTKMELLTRKGEVGKFCAPKWASGERSGNFDDYFKCKDYVMRRPSK